MAVAAVSVRQAEVADVEIIHRFSVELAKFQGDPKAVTASMATMARDGFGPDAQFQALIAEMERRPVGLATYNYFYSIWEGRRGIFLQDLWVSAEVRRQGVARALMRALAQDCCVKGCNRIDLNVLSWNPAQRFYDALGCRPLDQLQPYRLHGRALVELATARVGD
jgi:ribosomal protein S18 acetylase RimI-like enzyme